MKTWIVTRENVFEKFEDRKAALVRAADLVAAGTKPDIYRAVQVETETKVSLKLVRKPKGEKA